MLHNEEMLEMRLNSPSLSDTSSLASGCGLDDADEFELFPDLKELATSRQVSTDSEVSKDDSDDSSKRKIVAVRLDPGKEKELIDYLLGSDDGSLNNGDILKKIHRKVSDGQTYIPQNLLQVKDCSGYIDVSKTEYAPRSYTIGREYEGKCMSKNAVAARENRLRKKQYMSDLEQSVKSLSSENKNLKSQVTSMQQSVSDLKTEVKYLRSVLANQSTLSALLKNIPSVPGVNLMSSAADSALQSKRKGRKRPARDDESDEENIDSNIQVDERNLGVLEEVIIVDSDDNVCSTEVQTSGICTRGQMAKIPKMDHSYATNNPSVTQYQKRMQLKAQERHSRDDDTGGAGVCLHVSGSKVSLEFCSQCSRRASAEERELS